MKVITALLFALVAVSHVSGATVNPSLNGLAVWLNCVTSGTPCNLLDIFGSFSPDADLNLSGSLLSLTSGSSTIVINQTTNANSITFAAGSLTSSTINVVSGATINLASTLSVGVNSVISVSGAVIVAGATTVASGASFVANSGAAVSLNGGINVDAGASGTNQGLVVNGGASVTIGAASSINGALSLAQNSALYIRDAAVTSANSITAAGNTTVQGTLTISAAAGSYTQSAGTLILASASGTAGTIASDVVINANAVLRGNGTVTGSLSVSGTVAVGNSPGTVYCASYSMSSTSTFELEIASSTSYDQVVSRGSASINGILKGILLNNYVPATGEKYTFITALGAVSGSFNSVIGNTVATLTKFSYQANDHSVVAYYNNSGTTVAASVLLMIISFALSTL